MMTGAGVIERIWRYPIKSTGGELLHRAEVEPRGLVGDRLFAVRDAQGKFGSGKNTRRFRRMPGLLQLSSRYLGDAGEPALLDPRGAVAPDPNACLRRHLGREDVEVVREGEISHFDRLPVSVPTTATLDWVRSAVPGVPVDERRFRPNLLVRTPPGAPPFVEDEWSGSKARIRRRGVRRVRAVERAMRDDRRGPAGPPPLWCCGPSQKPMPCGWTGSPRSCPRDRYGRETPSSRSEKSSPG
ncbi:MOSC domain-containing protein [Streptomyces albus]|uniref:MOSC domain-containing protein n=2 Tax=Streptomyces TaxID=1883 RepID=UPI0003A923EE